MTVQFTDINGDTRKLMPAPFVTIAKEYQKAGDGEMLGCTYSISLSGTIVAQKGSPQSDGDWITTDENESLPTVLEKHKSVLNKIKAISNLFSSDNNGGLLEVDFEDGSDGFSAHVDIDGVDFGEGGNLVQKTDYSISLSANILYGPNGQNSDNEAFPYHVQSADESWEISEGEGTAIVLDANVGVSDVKKIYQLTHTMNATGKRVWDSTVAYGKLENTVGGEAWQQAMLYIRDKIGTKVGITGSVAGGYGDEQDFDNPVNTAIIGIYGMNLYGYTGWDYGRTQTIDKKAGSVSITETWTLAPATNGVKETLDIQISQTEGTGSPNSTNQITISGTIKGMVAGPGKVIPVWPGGDSRTPNSPTKYAETDANETKYTVAKARLAAILPLMDNIAKAAANTYICAGCGTFFSALPDSKTLGINVPQGEITYSFVYADKGQSYFGDGVQDSSFSVSETRPGHVLAVTPVMGRIYGPIIQDGGTQTEYKRSLSLSITVSRKKWGLTNSALGLRVKLFDLKPSNFGLIEHADQGIDLHPAGCLDAPFTLADVVTCNNAGGRTIKEQLLDVIEACAPDPAVEPFVLGMRVASPPTENWDIESGKYSYKIDWIYERTDSYYPLLTSAWLGGVL
jgi:hypothetical protein